MKKYIISLLLFCTASANAANTYNSQTGILNLDTLVFVQPGSLYGAVNYSNVTLKVTKASITRNLGGAPNTVLKAYYNAYPDVTTIFLPSVIVDNNTTYTNIDVVVQASVINPGTLIGPTFLSTSGSTCSSSTINDTARFTSVRGLVNSGSLNQVALIYGCNPAESYRFQGSAWSAGDYTWPSVVIGQPRYRIGVTVNQNGVVTNARRIPR